jgi:hypothetical protein
MTTEITRCSYSRSETDALKELTADQLKQVSVNATIGKIVTKYLQYDGDEVYTVNIRNGLINFTIEGAPDETRTLKLEAGKWQLIQGSTTTDVEGSEHIGSDITRVLERIRHVATATLPESITQTPAPLAPTVVSAPQVTSPSSTGGVTVNLYVNGQQVGPNPLSPTMQAPSLVSALTRGRTEGTSDSVPTSDESLLVLNARESTSRKALRDIGSGLSTLGGEALHGGLGLAKTGVKKLASGSLSVASSLAKKTQEKARDLTAKQWAVIMGTMVLVAGFCYMYKLVTTVTGSPLDSTIPASLCLPNSTLPGHC